ncbi:UNVERIFIED_CONTAM: Pentatricopeptide repeat-containing protein, chloroplastic [Sesamum indicum]
MMGNGLKGDDYTYGILIKGFCLTNRIAYCTDNNLVQALVIMEKCSSHGFVPDVTLTKVIEILWNAGRISEGVELLERVERNGGTLDVVAYNTLLKGFVKAGKVKAGYGFVKQMEIKGCLPNTDTTNVLFAVFCESGMLDSALDMFDEMKRVSVHWNFVTFETLIHGFCSTLRTGDGFKIFELMVEVASTFNASISGFCRLGKVVTAARLMEDLLMRGCLPDYESYGLIIKAFCRQGNFHQALMWFMQMVEKSIRPDYYAWNSLILVALEGKDLFQEHELMQGPTET